MIVDIQNSLFEKAKKLRDENTFITDDYDWMVKKNDEDNGFFNIHWCGSRACEDKLQNDNKITIRCIPFDNPQEEGKCIVCGSESKERVLAAKSF